MNENDKFANSMFVKHVQFLEEAEKSKNKDAVIKDITDRYKQLLLVTLESMVLIHMDIVSYKAIDKPDLEKKIENGDDGEVISAALRFLLTVFGAHNCYMREIFMRISSHMEELTNTYNSGDYNSIFNMLAIMQQCLQTGEEAHDVFPELTHEKNKDTSFKCCSEYKTYEKFAKFLDDMKQRSEKVDLDEVFAKN